MRIRSGYIRILTGPALNSGRPPEEFILGRDELVLTVKSKDGASVNMDGPFEFATFTFPKGPKQEGLKKQVVQEQVEVDPGNRTKR